MAGIYLEAIACHVINYHVTQAPIVENALDDVPDSFCQALPPSAQTNPGKTVMTVPKPPARARIATARGG